MRKYIISENSFQVGSIALSICLIYPLG